MDSKDGSEQQLLRWLEQLALGILTTEDSIEADDYPWSTIAQRLRQVQTRWAQERGEVLSQMVTSVRESSEFHDREMRHLAEHERMQRELLRAERSHVEAQMETRVQRASKMASIGQLAAGVAHEVNNPAAFIAANLSVLEANLNDLDGFVRDPAGRGILSDMRAIVIENLDGIRRIARIVRDLQSFSRIDSDEVRLINVNDIIDVTCNMVANEIRHRATLVKELGDVPRVRAVRGKLTQLFTNLIINAAQAIEEGHATENEIRISTRVDDGAVQVCVEDTGCGIPGNAIGRIFEPFFTTKPAGHGTGLGLAISADIVRQHAGQIDIASTGPDGTNVCVRLPIAEGFVRKDETVAPPSAISPGQSRARVLIVDDEPMVLKAFRRMLSRKGHDPVVAQGGNAALAILAEDSQFDAIICDLMMPDVDGIVVHEHVAKRAPDLAARMIFCSGGVFTDRAKKFVETTDNICLNKPVDFKRLLGILDSMCSTNSDTDG